MPKRRSDLELNQDNWDDDLKQDEVETFEKPEKGRFGDRKILTARRKRSPDKGTSGVFKAFTGFSGYSNNAVSFKFGKSQSDDKDSNQDEKNENEFLHELKVLNESVLDWITKHVMKDPHCILSPIFVDYEKHISDLRQKFPKCSCSIAAIPLNSTSPNASGAIENKSLSNGAVKLCEVSSNAVRDKVKSHENGLSVTSNDSSAKFSFTFGSTKNDTSVKSSTDLRDSSNSFSPKPSFNFGVFQNPARTTAQNSLFPNIFSPSNSQKPTFSFGLPPVTSKSDNTSPTPKVSFSTGFSFSAQPVSLSLPGNEVDRDEDNDEYVPPKPEVKEIKEEGSVYQIRCKLFYRSNNDWCERGLGNLFIKPTTEDRFQLLVRADTNLGNILLNILFTQDMPVKQQKNSLTFVCVPSPAIPSLSGKQQSAKDSSQTSSQLVPMLIRVKTESDATELLNKINFYRGIET